MAFPTKVQMYISGVFIRIQYSPLGWLSVVMVDQDRVELVFIIMKVVLTLHDDTVDT